MTGSLFPFVQRLVLSHLFHFGDWDLFFFPDCWELFVGWVWYSPDRRSLCATFYGFCTGWPLAADFTIFGVFGFVGFFASVLLLRWMRTAILAGGIAVVRSGSCSVFGLPKMVNDLIFVQRRLDY